MRTVDQGIASILNDLNILYEAVVELPSSTTETTTAETTTAETTTTETTATETTTAETTTAETTTAETTTAETTTTETTVTETTTAEKTTAEATTTETTTAETTTAETTTAETTTAETTTVEATTTETTTAETTTAQNPTDLMIDDDDEDEEADAFFSSKKKIQLQEYSLVDLQADVIERASQKLMIKSFPGIEKVLASPTAIVVCDEPKTDCTKLNSALTEVDAIAEELAQNTIKDDQMTRINKAKTDVNDVCNDEEFQEGFKNLDELELAITVRVKTLLYFV